MPTTPYARDEGSGPTPSRNDIRSGLASLGIKLGNDQVEKLLSMGGENVLQSIIKSGAQEKKKGNASSSAAPPQAPSTAAPSAPRPATSSLKHADSLPGLMKMKGPESHRQTARGDDARDADRVVTGPQSDRHRHFRAHEMGRNKTQIGVLAGLKACDVSARAVFRKIQEINKGTKHNNGKNTTITPSDLHRGVQELAGIQLCRQDLEGLVSRINGGVKSKEVSLESFSRALDSVDATILPKTSRTAREEHIKRINLTNVKSDSAAAAALQHRRNTVSEIDAKVSKRFGSEPDRLRRLFFNLQRNGDGTVSKTNLRKGMEHLGMALSEPQFGELMKGVEEAQRSAGATVVGDDIYFSDLIHVFEKAPMAEGPPINSVDMGVESRHREEEARRDHSALKRGGDIAASLQNSGLPDHFMHVDFSHRKVDPFAEAPKPNTEGRRRPKQHTDEERKAIRIKKTLLAKLDEKGKSIADAFVLLDSDRDGMVTQHDMKRGLMMGLGIQLAKEELSSLIEHTIPPSKEGVSFQEFSARLLQDDAYHAYMNDKLGSGGGGDLEGPVAAAVGIDAVKRWTGRREHRSSLSSALTARGTVSIGPQYADPHGVGVVGGTTSAAEWSANLAAENQPSIEERRARKIAEEFGEKVRRRTQKLSDTFRDMDINSHGSLSYSELRNGLDRVGVHLTDEDFRILTKRLDKNGDGRVEFQEFAKTVRGDVRASELPTEMAKPPVDKDGNGIRVGMTLTTTQRNNSKNIGEIMQMPSAKPDAPVSPIAKQSQEDSWLKDQASILGEDKEFGVSKRRSPSSTSLSDLSHVATRLKVRDALASKISNSLREQYLSLQRGPASGFSRGGAVTVDSFYRTLKGRGAAVSKKEVARLLVDSGVANDVQSAYDRRITFNDFKRLVHLKGLGNDVRSYDFARAVQLPPAVGLEAGGLREAERHNFDSMTSHEPKHLNQPAGGKRAHGSPEHAPRKRVWFDKNRESGAVASMIEANHISVVRDDDSDLMHNVGTRDEHRQKHSNHLYRHHDHIRELGIIGEGHASLGSEGMIGETMLHHGHGRSHLHAKNALDDHISNGYEASSSKSTPKKVQKKYNHMSVSPGNSAAPGKRMALGAERKQTGKKTRLVKTQPHLQSSISIKHDHIKHERWGGKKRIPRPSPNTKVLRLACPPPVSPAARAAAEKNASAAMFRGAAGVSTASKDTAHHSRKIDGKRYKSNGLFSNMAYPNHTS